MDTNKSRLICASDFERNTCSILGLPLDLLDMQGAVEWVYHAIDNKQSCFISTPNLNFLIASQTNEAFRRSVINSDLSLADGIPLIWIAKLLQIPLRERVPGSGLIEALMHSKARMTTPIKVFFFGGQDTVAEQACEKIRQNPYGIECVGSFNPGFGSIEEMSQPQIIETINRSRAEFIIVSLGARKGQAWIEHNRERLDAPVISHLGAVVNFVAGTVARAPLFWQRLGLEWFWRIKEEPALWKRYLLDGLAFLQLLLIKVLPYALIIYYNRKKTVRADHILITVSEGARETIISMEGIAVAKNLQPLRDVLMNYFPKTSIINIELGNVDYVDPSFIGLLLVLYKNIGERLRLTNPSTLVRKILAYNGAGFLLK